MAIHPESRIGHSKFMGGGFPVVVCVGVEEKQMNENLKGFLAYIFFVTAGALTGLLTAILLERMGINLFWWLL